MKRVNSVMLGYISRHWRGIISAGLIASLALIIVIPAISIIDGQNRFETNALNQFINFPSPWYRAVFAPFYIVAYLLTKITSNPLESAKIASAFFCLFGALCLFILAKLWFNIRIAIVVTLLLITSSWFLAISHQALPLCLLIAWPLFLLVPLAFYLRFKRYRFFSFIVFAIVLAISLYIPYLFWVDLVVMAVLLFKEKKKLLLLKSWQIVVAGIIFLVFLLPLFYSLLHHPGQVVELLGIPLNWPTFSQYYTNLIGLVAMIFIKSKPLPELFVGNLPMLDVFSSVMFILGIYYFAVRLPNRRSIIMFGSMLILVLVLPLTPLYQLFSAILLPFIFITITMGFIELINQWVAYFPRNPLVKNFGLVLIVLSIGLISFYNLQKFYIAWPNNTQVKQAYVVKSK
jgi:hypothetical protein